MTKIINNLDDEFKELCDRLVMLADSDEELAIGLKVVDEEAKKRDVSFYEMVYIYLSLYVADRKAKDWLENKTK